MNYLKTNEGQKLIESFLSKYRKSSKFVYESEIRQFETFVNGNILNTKESDIIAYREHLEVSQSSLTRKISILSKFFSFLEKNINGFKNPILGNYGSQSKYKTPYFESERYKKDVQNWLSSLNVSNGTKETYRINLQTTMKVLKVQPKELTANDIQKYKNGISNKYQSTTVWIKLVSLNSFLKFVLGIEKASKLISFKELGLIPPKKDKGYYQVLNENELQRLLEQPDKSDFGRRNKAMLWLSIGYGLRPNEICKICYDDFESDRVQGQQKLWIRDRKGIGTDTAIILNGKALDSMDDWLTIAKEKIDYAEKKTPIFSPFKWNMPNKTLEFYRQRIKDKNPLTVRAFQEVLKRYVDSAKIERKFKVTPHALRHSALTLLAKSGVELIDLKYLAGHQDLSTTMIYIHSVQSYQDHVGLYHPLNK